MEQQPFGGGMHEASRLTNVIAKRFMRTWNASTYDSLADLIERRWSQLLAEIRTSLTDIVHNGVQKKITCSQIVNGCITEYLGQEVMRYALRTSNEPDIPEIISDTRGTIVQMGDGFWKFDSQYNIEFLSSPFANDLTANRVSEVDMAITMSDGDYLTFIDFGRPNQIPEKAGRDARRFSTIQQMAPVNCLSIQKLHIVFGGKRQRVKFHPLLTKKDREPVVDCFLLRVKINNEIHDFFDAANETIQNTEGLAHIIRMAKHAGV